MQTVIPLYHGGAVKLTTAQYYTPSGNSIQAQGIVPQVLLTPLRVQQDETAAINERESALPYHLANPTNQTAQNPAQPPQSPDLAKQDFALYEALNILKTMAILQASIAPETQLPESPAADAPPPTTITTEKEAANKIAPNPNATVKTATPPTPAAKEDKNSANVPPGIKPAK